MNRKVIGHEDRDLFVELLAADGDVLWSSDNTPALDRIALPTAERPAALIRVIAALPRGPAADRTSRTCRRTSCALARRSTWSKKTSPS